MNFPALNPLRFLSTDWVDYLTSFPNVDNQQIGVQYYKDEIPLKYIREHVVNKAIKFQSRFHFIVAGEEYIQVYKNGEPFTTVAITNITPAGWVGETYYEGYEIVGKVEYTPTTIGVYEFRVAHLHSSETFSSDKINVVATGVDLIEVKYVHSANDFSNIFWDGVTSKFEGLVYFQGTFNVAENSITSKSVYSGNKGSSILSNATPVSKYTLVIDTIHKAYLGTIQKMFCCDTLTINGMSLVCVDEIKVEKIEGTDCRKITIELTEKTVDYLLK